MTAKEYKQYKGLRKESLRDNMDNIEIILADLSEETTKRLAEKHRPQGLEQNKEVARMGSNRRYRKNFRRICYYQTK